MAHPPRPGSWAATPRSSLHSSRSGTDIGASRLAHAVAGRAILAGDVRLPVVVGLGEHGDDALHLVLEPVVGTGGHEQPILLDARLHVLQDDSGAEPRGHRTGFARHGEPAVARRLRVETRGLPD